MSETTTSSRTTVALPSERFAQLKGLADARQLSPAGLIDHWIDEAVEKGEPGASHPPGYWALRDDDIVFLQIAGQHLPAVKNQRAALLATVLQGAAGVSQPNTKFELPVGRAVPVDLDDEGARLTVGRHGRGVLFVLDESGKQTKFAAPPSLVASVARQIWKELGPSN